MSNAPFSPIVSPQPAAPKTRGSPTRSLYPVETLRRVVAAWRERNHFHVELERKLKGDPHLIDDIGLTRRQVEEELARPFWQVL
ncbi:DUF1127 domain-containing protein [Ensifer sp. ENS09]|uniref:DUF1127 domain-containing protein n=1 Tax=Ensifer sp. ENS09 TaxID=2769263 RepID=UPI001FEDCC5A|nr:DUF1127 domain-containing protein [Ensifer sp. ENS09]